MNSSHFFTSDSLSLSGSEGSATPSMAFGFNDETDFGYDFIGKDARNVTKRLKYEQRCLKDNKQRQKRMTYTIKDYLFKKNIVVDSIGFQQDNGHKYYYYNALKNSCINISKKEMARIYRYSSLQNIKTTRLDDDILLIDTTGFVFEPQLGLSDFTNGLKYIYDIFTNGFTDLKNMTNDIKDKLSFITQIPGFLKTFKDIKISELLENILCLFLSFYTVSYSPIGFLQFCFHLFKIVRQLNPILNFSFSPQSISLDMLMGAFVFFGLPNNLISALKDFSLLIGRKVTSSHTLQSLFNALRNILIMIFDYIGTFFGLEHYTTAITDFIDFLFRPFKHYSTMLQIVTLYTKFITDQSVLHDPIFRQQSIELYENIVKDDSFSDWIKNNDNKHFIATYESFCNNLIKMARTYTTSEKDEPICIVFDGPPGSGKTVLMNKFVTWLKELNMTVYVHTVPPTETSKDFYDDYLNQDVFVMDDVGQQGKSQWRTIINFVAPIKYPLDCAQADKKNTKFFNSKLIICTTNNFEDLCGFTSKDAISNKDALFRRVHLIKVNRLPHETFRQQIEYKKYDFTTSKSWKTEFLAHNNFTTDYHDATTRPFPLKITLSGANIIEKSILWLDMLLKHLTLTEEMNREILNKQLDLDIMKQILNEHSAADILKDMETWTTDFIPQSNDDWIKQKMENARRQIQEDKRKNDISLTTYFQDGWNQLHNGANIFQEFVKNSYEWLINNVKLLIKMISDKFISKILNRLEKFGNWLKTRSKFLLNFGKTVSLETYEFSIEMLKFVLTSLKKWLFDNNSIFRLLFPNNPEAAMKFTNGPEPTVEINTDDSESYRVLSEIVGNFTIEDIYIDTLLEHYDEFEEHITEDGRWLYGDKLGTEIDERKRLGISNYAKPDIFMDEIPCEVPGASYMKHEQDGTLVLDYITPPMPNPIKIYLAKIKAIYNDPYGFLEYIWNTVSFQPLIYFGLTILATTFVSELFTSSFAPQASILSFLKRWFGNRTLAEDSFELSKEKVEQLCKIEPKSKTLDFIARHMRIMVCPSTGEHTCILVSGSRFLTNSHVSKEGTIVDIYRSVEHFRNKHKEMESVKIKVVRDYITQDITVCEFLDVVPLYPLFNRFGFNGTTDDNVKLVSCDFASPYGALGLLPTVHATTNDTPVYYKWRCGEVTHKANSGYLYTIDGPGLCGSIVLADGRAIGCHVSGNGTNGFAKVFPKYLASELNDLMTTGPRMKNIEQYELDDRVLNDFSGVRVKYPDEEKKLFYSHPMDHTDLRPTEMNFCLNDEMKELYREINELPTADNLYLKSPPNFSAKGSPAQTLQSLGMKSFEHQGFIGNDELDFIGEYIGSILPDSFDDLSDDETSFGGENVPKFNRHSSNGLGFLKGKTAVMDFEKRILTEYGRQRLDEFEENARQMTFDVRDLTCRETFKDELRKPDKVNKPRTFRVMPFGHIWWTKKTCGKLLKHFKSHIHDYGVCVGFNPYKDFDKLHEKLSAKDIHGDADFGNWDGRTLSLMAMAIKDELLKRYNGKYPHVINYVFITMMRSWTVMAGDLYSTTHSLPSGTWLTLLLNCLINKALTALTIYRTYKNNSKTPTVADVHKIVDYVTGDDKIFGSDILSDYDLRTVATVATDLGMVVTNGDKTPITARTQDMGKLTFVKRSFVFHPVLKRWMGALDINTLLNTLQWYSTRSNATYDEIIKGKCNSVLIEAYIHGPTCYEKFYAFIKRSLPNLEFFSQDRIIEILNDDNGYAIMNFHKNHGDVDAIWDDMVRLGLDLHD